jgi:hypothetical protein
MTSLNPTVFHNLAKDLFGRLDINFDNRTDNFTDICPDVEQILSDSQDDFSSLNNKLSIKFSSAELIKLSKPEEFDNEIKRLAAMDNANPTDPSRYDPNSPIKKDVAVLEQIFAFTATLNNKQEELRKLIRNPNSNVPRSLYKLDVQLTDAVARLKYYILLPILDSLDKLFAQGNYRGELKSVINNLLANMSPSFNKFLGTEDREIID